MFIVYICCIYIYIIEMKINFLLVAEWKYFIRVHFAWQWNEVVLQTSMVPKLINIRQNAYTTCYDGPTISCDVTFFFKFFFFLKTNQTPNSRSTSSLFPFLCVRRLIHFYNINEFATVLEHCEVKGSQFYVTKIQYTLNHNYTPNWHIYLFKMIS